MNNEISFVSNQQYFGDQQVPWFPGKGGFDIQFGFSDLKVTPEFGAWKAKKVHKDRKGVVKNSASIEVFPCAEKFLPWKQVFDDTGYEDYPESIEDNFYSCINSKQISLRGLEEPGLPFEYTDIYFEPCTNTTGVSCLPWNEI
jgi:hypothetical protein